MFITVDLSAEKMYSLLRIQTFDKTATKACLLATVKTLKSITCKSLIALNCRGDEIVTDKNPKTVRDERGDKSPIYT